MIMHLVYRMKGGCKSKKTSERLLACLLCSRQTSKRFPSRLLLPFAKKVDNHLPAHLF